MAEATPTLAVVAYPVLRDDDRQWVEGIRARHDPLASRIKAHFTFVFPAQMAEEPLLAHVRAALPSFEPIPFVLRRAAALRDAIGKGYYVFLLPEEGRTQLLSLHDRLYDSALASQLPGDVPFVPHVTVGAHPQLGECERIANHLNAERRMVQGTVESVEVIEVGELMVSTVARMPLGRGGNTPPNLTVQRTGGSRCSPSDR